MDEMEFERQSRLSLAWLNSSTNLRGSAAALWASMDDEAAKGIAERFGLGRGFSMKAAVPPVFRMLCGLSLELLYKAVVVSQKKELPDPPIHLLERLAHLAGIPVSAGDKKLLAILTEEAIWAGRYPLPIRKRRKDLARLTALRSEALYDRKPFGKRHILAPNGALSWDGFNRLWRTGVSYYEPPDPPRALD